MFIAEHGSWNRKEKSGYGIATVRLEDNGASNRAISYEPFATGFHRDDEVFGRPVDLLLLEDGSWLVSDDLAGALYRLSYSHAAVTLFFRERTRMKTISTIFSFLWRSLDALRKVLHLIVLLVIFVVVLAVLSPAIPIVPHSAALVIAPQGALVEQLSGDPFQRAFSEVSGTGNAETLVRDLVEAVEAAQEGRSHQGAGAGSGQHDRRRCRQAGRAGSGRSRFSRRRQEGDRARRGLRPDRSTTSQRTPTTSISIRRELVFIEGYGYYRTFLKGVIDKLAVDVNIFRAGKFKSYTDQYSRSDMSEQEREESLAWLNALWTQYQAGVTKARGIDAGAIAAYVNELAPAARVAARRSGRRRAGARAGHGDSSHVTKLKSS